MRQLTYRISIVMLSALCCWSCAVSDSTDTTQMSKTYFESWIQLHYPGISPTPLGSYIIEDKEGSGELVGNSVNAPYVYGRYILRDLDGTIQDYTDESVAKQLGLYDSTCYYGPKVWLRKDSTMTAGVDEIVSTMRVGGHRKAVVPGWLNTQIRYKDKDEYLANVTGESSIYEIRIVEIIKDVIAWQADSMKKFVDARFKDRDTTSFGYYYIQTCFFLDFSYSGFFFTFTLFYMRHISVMGHRFSAAYGMSSVGRGAQESDF